MKARGCLLIILLATAGLSMAEDPLSGISEAEPYRLVYDLDLKKLKGKISYDIDNSKDCTNAFDRIAYLIELRHKDRKTNEYLYVSMDAFTDNAEKIGIPFHGSGIKFQCMVSNLVVDSNVKGIQTGGSIPKGNLEFWSSNYSEGNSKKIPGADPKKYDFGDQPSGSGNGHGSMQVHHFEAKQTLFAINNWKNGKHAGIGIGNSPTGNPDWTFSKSGADYTKKRLRIFIREAGRFYPLEGKIGEVRTWTSRGGDKILAKLVSAEDGDVVLFTAKRRTMSITLAKLSDEDQEYIRRPLKTSPSGPVIVKPVAIVEDSGCYTKRVSPQRLIDGSGLDKDLKTGDPVPKDLPTHNGDYKTMWMNDGSNVKAQYMVFDLGKVYEVTAAHLWPFALEGRYAVNLREFSLFVSETHDHQGRINLRSKWLEAGTFAVEAKDKPQSFPLPKPVKARYILLDILSNHAVDEPFVGLSEVRFAGVPVGE